MSRLRLRAARRREGVWRPIGLPRRPLDALASDSPLAHRLAHAAVARGFRGRTLYWRFAERLADRPDRAQLVLRGGIRIGLDCSDVGERRMYEGGYQPAERSLLAALATKGGTVLDVGANIGVFAGACAALVGEHGCVYAFEPNPQVFARLRATIGDMPQVRARPVALSDEPGTGSLAVEPSHHGATALRAADRGALTVTVSTIDEVVRREAIGGIDLIKIDVEGAEERVIRGAQAVIQSRCVAHVLLEVHPARRSSRWLENWLVAIADDYRIFRLTYESVSLGLRRSPRLVDDDALPAGPSSFNLLVSRRDRISTD